METIIESNVNAWSIWNNDYFEGIIIELPTEWTNYDIIFWINDNKIINNLENKQKYYSTNYLLYLSLPILAYYFIYYQNSY